MSESIVRSFERNVGFPMVHAFRLHRASRLAQALTLNREVIYESRSICHRQ
jgi:hypothetical protein